MRDITRLPGSNAGSTTSALVELRLPPELLDALVERMRLAVAEALDAQVRPAELLNDERVCIELLGVSTRTLRDVLLPAGLPYLRVGDMRRYDRTEVIAWLRARRETTAT